MAIADTRNMRMPEKISATITDARETYALAVDANSNRYIIMPNGVEQMGRWAFEDLMLGSQVKLIPIDGPKGLRGIDVEIVAV